MKILSPDDQTTKRAPFEKCPASLICADVSDGAVRLYLWLKTFDRGHGVYPSLETLAEKLDCSTKTVERYRDELHKRGYLTWRRRWVSKKQICDYQIFMEPQLTRHESPVSKGGDKTLTSTHSTERLDNRKPTDSTFEGKVTRHQWRGKSDSSGGNHIQGNQSVNQSTSPIETVEHEDGPGLTDGWTLPESLISELRTTIAQTSSLGLINVSQARAILGVFRTEKEAERWLRLRFRGIGHKHAKSPAMYRADAQKWVVEYREELAKNPDVEQLFEKMAERVGEAEMDVWDLAQAQLDRKAVGVTDEQAEEIFAKYAKRPKRGAA